MPGAVISVRDPTSGETFAIDEADYRADPDAYELVEGQTVAYDPTGGVAPVTGGLEATRETLLGPSIGERLSPERLAAEERTQTAEELEGGAGGIAKAIARGVGSAATLRASELLFEPDSGIEAELEQMRQDVVGKYQAGAELIGDVGLTLLSGGTGALARGARLTAPGLIARAGGRVAGRSPTLLRQMAAGAFETAATNVGRAIAADALRDEPLSGAALASTMGTSLLLGGGAAGVLGLAGRGLGRAVRRDAATPAEELISAASDPAALARTLRDAEANLVSRAADDLAAPVSRKPVRLGSLFSKRGKSPELSRRAARELIDQVQARTARAASAREALENVVEASRAAGSPLPEDLVTRARMAIDDQELAARAAAEHMPEVVTGVDRAAAGEVVPASGAAVPAMRRLDAADRDLSQALGEVRKAIPAPAVASSAAPEAQSLLSRGADVIGALELAGAAGVPLPSVADVPGVGPALSMLARVRTLARAAGRVGLVPGSQATDAAELAAKAADRFRATLDRASRGRLVTSGALPRALRKITTASARTIIDSLDHADSAGVQRATVGRWSELPAGVQSEVVATNQARVNYLQGIAPKPPPGFETMPDAWRPPPTALARFAEVASALESPLQAVGAVLSGEWRYPLEVVAGVRAVFPQVYQEVQRHMIETAPQTIRNNPRERVAFWARLFDVQILPELQPSYSTPPASMPAPAPGGLPPSSARSPIAESAEVRPGIRRG